MDAGVNVTDLGLTGTEEVYSPPPPPSGQAALKSPPAIIRWITMA